MNEPKPKRTIDPGIAAIRAESAEKVKALRATQVSARVLKAILGTRLAQMTEADKRLLRDVLNQELPPTPANTK